MPQRAMEERPLLKSISRVGWPDLSVVTSGKPQHHLAGVDTGTPQIRLAE